MIPPGPPGDGIVLTANDISYYVSFSRLRELSGVNCPFKYATSMKGMPI
jgi:hypothetical protein